MLDTMKGQAAKSVLSDLLKKLRAFGLDEPDGDEADVRNNDVDDADSTDGTDLDVMSKNPDNPGDAADFKEGVSLDDLAKPGAEDGAPMDPLKAEMQKFFQKTDADKTGSPKGVRMNMTEIKAVPAKRPRL